MSQNESSNTKVAPKAKNAAKAKLDAKFSISGSQVTVSLPLRTVSEANTREFWAKRHTRHSRQKKAIILALNPVRDKITLPCHVKLTRLAPRKLDRWDNLPAAMKYILDACCEVITGDDRPGRGDGDSRITVSYDQIACREYGVSLEFTCLNEDPDAPTTC